MAVICLFIGHPVFVFKDRQGKSDYSNVSTTVESIVLLESEKTAY
jgi:hypothetical protein